MVKFKFFVHCTGWKNGGYENARFANNATEAKRIIANWNAEGIRTTLLSITPISNEEFARDYIY